MFRQLPAKALEAYGRSHRLSPDNPAALLATPRQEQRVL